MAYTSGFTAVTSATFTAAQYNTNVRDNFAAIWVFTTAGDLIYATSATTAARLALVADGLLYGGASAPAWLAASAGKILYSNPTPSWVTLSFLMGAWNIVASQAAGDWFYAATASSLGRIAATPYGIPRNNAAGTGADSTAFRMCEATRAKRGTDLSSTSISETAIALTGEDFDDGGWHSNVTNNERITPPTTGRYRTRGQMQIENASGTNIDSVVLKIKSSTGSIIGATTTIGFVNGANIFLSVTGYTEALTAGEYFTLTTERSNVTSGVTIKATNTWLEVERVR